MFCFQGSVRPDHLILRSAKPYLLTNSCVYFVEIGPGNIFKFQSVMKFACATSSFDVYLIFIFFVVFNPKFAGLLTEIVSAVSIP